MQGHDAEIRAHGAEVVVVSFEPPGRLPGYRARLGWPFPVVSDPERVAYRAFGLGSAGWTGLLSPKVLLRYGALMLRGDRPRPTDQDVHQLGGDFVLDGDRRIAYAYRSADPADRPPASALVETLRRLAAEAPGAEVRGESGSRGPR